MTSRKRLQNNGESSQSSTHQLTTPKTSRWNAVNVPLQRRGTTSGINSRPSGIERPPFSIGPGESRGVICAVCHSNNVDRTVGLAFVNIPIAEAVLTTVADTQLYPQAIHKIQMMEASRVLMQPTPPSLAQSALSLRQHIGEELPCVPIVETPKSDWSEHVGMQCIRRVAFAADLPHLEFAVRDNSHALCAFAAVMKYIREDFGFDFDARSVRIKYQPPADVMMISLPTIRSLELIQNARADSTKECLFGLLNQTITPMGSRILRSNILQPSTKASVLNRRFDAVGELARNSSLLADVQDGLRKLKRIGDIEQLLTKLVILPKDGSLHEAEQAINNVLKLKTFLTTMPNMFDSLSEATSPLLSCIRNDCDPEKANDVLEVIIDTVDPNATYATKPLELRNQRVHTVKHEISAGLDIQRKLYEDFSERVHGYVNGLEDELRVKIKIKYSATRKFYLQVDRRDFGAQGLPDVLINRNKVKSSVECQTIKLVGFNERINQAVHGAMMESDDVIKALLASIRPQVSTLFKYCESIALLDLLASFASLAHALNYTRPAIQNGAYGIVGARHPILDSRGLGKCIPNDYFATEETRFQIITGQNMSGKSTYIRAIAMLQIMVQVGCFIPAETARMPIQFSLFARVSTDDLLEANLSTFSVEMREMAFILRNVSNKSLVIVDELGRATSTHDGLSIAAAMSEALIQSNATVFFATHFIELARGFAHNIGVVNRHLQAETQNSADACVMKMLYRVADGAETETSYGIALAKTLGFPAPFIARAEKVAAELRANAQANKNDREQIQEAKRRKLVANLARQLQLAQQSQAEDEELWQYLKQIHDDFWAAMLSSTENADGRSGEEKDPVMSRENSADVGQNDYAVRPRVSEVVNEDGLAEYSDADDVGEADEVIMVDADDRVEDSNYYEEDEAEEDVYIS